jgi:hypothetical protein
MPDFGRDYIDDEGVVHLSNTPSWLYEEQHGQLMLDGPTAIRPDHPMYERARRLVMPDPFSIGGEEPGNG